MWKRSIVAIQKFCYQGNMTSHFSSPQEMSTRRLLHVRIHCVWIFLFQSQGQENDIILVSLVRSNKEGVIGYLASMDRLCVAISRARCGLYLFGNHAHLSQKSKKGWKVCNRDYLRYIVPAHGYVYTNVGTVCRVVMQKPIIMISQFIAVLPGSLPVSPG